MPEDKSPAAGTKPDVRLRQGLPVLRGEEKKPAAGTRPDAGS